VLINIKRIEHPMTDPNYIKTNIIYKSLKLIEKNKNLALRDLAAYANDPVRYKRRLRFLRELSQYELNLLTNFENFVPDNVEHDFNNDTLKKIRESIDLITLQNS
jgi:hypothetical protein